MRRVAALLATAALVGCAPGAPEGRDLTAAQASAYFVAHRDRLETLVRLLDACRPVDASGAADIRRDDGGATRCATADQTNLARIRAWLKREDFVAASYYTADRRPMSPIAGVQIMTQTAGLGVSGAMTSLTYSTTPRADPNSVDRREDGSLIAETRALTPAPFQWFWEHSR